MAIRRKDGKAQAKRRGKTKAESGAKRAIKAARLRKHESTTMALRKLDRAMSKTFGKDYDTKLSPLGITLSEKVVRAKRLEWTATGTVKCTFSALSCGSDVDS